MARGGRGGAGNLRYKSSTNQAPRKAKPGEKGEEGWVWLRLKLIADIGLVGMPNAGKSTLLSVLSEARPKIAPYPFTTLHPHLGVISFGHGERLVMADIPGLIEGASEGHGLGTRFLGHIERTQAFVHMIDGTQEHPEHAFQLIRRELEHYGAGLEEKPEILVLNKVDAMGDEERQDKIKALETLAGQPVITISAVTGEGLDTLKKRLFDFRVHAKKEEMEAGGWMP